MNLKEVLIRPVCSSEEPRYQELMQGHHYLGDLGKIGETLWYVATWREHWVALWSFSSPALKCAARDRWIGWNFRHQFNRLKLVTNNSRFLILPKWHVPNLASRILSLCQKRLPSDWQKSFGHPLVLLETFVDPLYFHGTVYKAANWIYVGDTKGYQRTKNGYTDKAQFPKMVKDISADALLTQLSFAEYLVTQRGAHYHFTVKGNQSGLYKDIELYFQNRQEPNFADAKRVLSVNRGHWCIESCHYIIDWNFDEDRSRIRTGYGPENVTRLRRFAVGLIKSKGVKSVAQKMRQLNKNTRAVLDYLKMSKNSCQTEIWKHI